jgi:hypothetical protein
MQKAGTSGAAPPKPITVVDGKTARDDVNQSFGLVPEFLRRYPQEGIAGAWTGCGLAMNPNTAIPGKYKTLVGLAVAAQIPCKFCIIADTEFAKLLPSSTGLPAARSRLHRCDEGHPCLHPGVDSAEHLAVEQESQTAEHRLLGHPSTAGNGAADPLG